MTHRPAIVILVTDDPSHINIRNLSSTPACLPSPARASYYPQLSLPPRVSIIKLDPDDASLTRTKIEEGELGEAEVWRRGDKMTSRQREMDDGGGHW